MKSQTEVELKFLVPAAARVALAAEMARGSTSLERISLAAMYLDTEDRRLATQGLAWRLRREGRRWIQTLKAGGSNALERFEHEVIRPDASHDVAEHAGTPVGDRLISVLRQARAEGFEIGVRFRTEVRRTARRVRTRGAVVEVAFDEGRLVAGGTTQRIREIEFELVSGSTAAMLAMAERWRKRFGLIYDPRSKAERGDRLAEGSPFPRLRKGEPPAYSKDANAVEAFGSVIDECLAQISRNAVGLTEGDAALRVEHVHQLRVGIRRLRSALRSFRGWAPSPPAELVDGLRALFGTLGLSRDSDVLDSGVVAELARVGAPALTLPAGDPGPSPVEAIKADGVQHTFLAWIAWRAALAEAPEEEPAAAPNAAASPAESSTGGPDAEAPAETVASEIQPAPAHANAPKLRRRAEKRLRRWHASIAADWQTFDALEEAQLHELRKRIKRQRYAVEFFAPLLRRRSVERYLKILAKVQDRMGELNDLFVARARYQALVESDPAAWFALGWLTARIAEVRALAKPELGRLAKADSPAS